MARSMQRLRVISNFCHFNSILSVTKSKINIWNYSIRTLSNDGRITIDGITKTIQKSTNPELVPKKFRKFICIVCLAEELFHSLLTIICSECERKW